MRQVHQFEQIVDQPRALCFGDVVARREEIQVLPDLHIVIDAKEVRHIAYRAAKCTRVFRHFMSSHKRLSRRRQHERGENAHGAGLACAVWPHEAVNRTARNLQRQMIYRGKFAITLHQVSRLNDQIRVYNRMLWLCLCCFHYVSPYLGYTAKTTGTGASPGVICEGPPVCRYMQVAEPPSRFNAISTSSPDTPNQRAISVKDTPVNGVTIIRTRPCVS